MNNKRNSCGCGQQYNECISCDVRNCVYHAGESHCTANKIAVGPSSAVTSADTVCATFKPREE